MLPVNNRRNSIKRLLKEELEYFNEILDETKAFFDKFNYFSVGSIVDLLDSRQKRIIKIKGLEKKLEELKNFNGEGDVRYIEQEISIAATSLIVIDANILDILHTIKSQYVNDMAKVTNSQNIVGDGTLINMNKSRVVDIIQE